MNMNDDKLKAALGRLPREAAPQGDLWPGISARIARKSRVRPLWAYGLAASLVAAVAAGSVWNYLHLQHGAAPLEVVASGTSHDSAYFAQRAAFAESSVQNATNLAPATREVILKNLRIIEGSMQDIQTALDKDPSNPRLRGLLYDLYQNEARLLAATQQADAKTNARNSL